jgi:PPIC-type PPIASE domain
MQRRVTTLVGLAVVGLALWIAMRDLHAPKGALSRGSHDGKAEGDDSGILFAYADGSAPAAEDGGLALVGDLSNFATTLLRADAGAGTRMPDGLPVPPLPLTAPRQVRFGVVLVTYAGAQPSTTGIRPQARSREDAKILADKLAAAAQQDFHAAVQQGDAGSADDVGRVKQGILEPAPEYVLFSLPIDAVGGPVETPRGYWIVKRLE